MIDRVLGPRPRARASRCWRRSCAGARASTRRSSTDFRRQGFVRVRIDGALHDLARGDPRSRRRSATTSTWWSTASRCARRRARAHRRVARDGAAPGAAGLVTLDVGAGRRAAAALRAQRLRELRLQLPGDRAAPVLVQQPARRLPRVRRARHTRRLRPGAHRARRRRARSRTAPSTPWRGGGSLLRAAARRARGAPRCRARDALARAARSARATALLHGLGEERVLAGAARGAAARVACCGAWTACSASSSGAREADGGRRRASSRATGARAPLRGVRRHAAAPRGAQRARRRPRAARALRALDRGRRARAPRRARARAERSASSPTACCARSASGCASCATSASTT